MSFAASYAMMKPLVLTPDEERMIVDEADRIIAETFEARKQYVANNRELPRSEWKHVKSKEDLHVYRSTEKPTSNNRRERTGTPNNSSSQEASAIEITTPINLPLIVSTGTMAVTAEDSMLGAMAHTESTWRHRCAIIKDEYDAMKILATIKAPTPDEPFNSILVKWESKRVGALSRIRDIVFVEVTALVLDDDGNQVAIHVVHSIDNIPRITGLRHLDIVRLTVSTCWLGFRNDETSIELFGRGFSDPGGNFAAAKGHNMIYPEMLLAAALAVDCAHVRRLIWLMKIKRREAGESVSLASPSSSSHSSNSNSSASKNSNQGAPASNSKACGNCSESLTKIGSLIRSRIVCRACHEAICYKCSVEKSFPIETKKGDVKLKQLAFCLRCLLEAKQVSAHTVALAMLENHS